MGSFILKGSFKNFVWRFINKTLSDPDTFNLFCFLTLNFSFAFIELFYGLLSNSLGLLSDSFHMFFDSFSILTGLIASIISKWSKTKEYTFGYGRAEILSGFINGLLLVFISFFILKEAIERLMEQTHTHIHHHHRLFTISILGLIVNIIGIFVFHHGHSSNSKCSHGHSHHNHSSEHHVHNEKYDKNSKNVRPQPSSNTTFYEHSNTGENSNERIITPIKSQSSSDVGFEHVKIDFEEIGDHNHEHHPHKHQHSQNQIIKGVFLHIVADTLGSIAVIISSYLVSSYKLMIADTICSLCCSILIFISAFPLLKESFMILMERIPRGLEANIFSSIEEIKRMPGVYSVVEYHVWTICTDNHYAALSVAMAQTVDSVIITNRIKDTLYKNGIKNSIIQTIIAT